MRFYQIDTGQYFSTVQEAKQAALEHAQRHDRTVQVDIVWVSTRGRQAILDWLNASKPPVRRRSITFYAQPKHAPHNPVMNGAAR